MIIKSLSRRSGGIGQLFRYLFREEKVTRSTPRKLVSLLSEKMIADKAVYIAGIRLSEKDVEYLRSEIQDAKLLSDMKAFKGTVKEFIQQRLIGQRPDIAKETKPLVITHNLRGRSINSYIKEFEQIDANRMRHSVNQVAVNHVILSWANTDAAKISDAMLKDMAKEYIRLRGENNLYVIVKHEDQLHTHLHVTVSGTQLNGLSSRVSKKEFADIKLGMDLFQKTHFPTLVNSLPNHGKVSIEKSPKDILKNKNSERLLDKESLLEVLRTSYAKATSVEQFLSEIQAHGHEPYYRDGRLQGVLYEGDRKFRLKPLGYDTEKLQALEMQKTKDEKLLNELRDIRTKRTKENVRNLNDSILEADAKNATDKKTKTAMQEIEDVRNNKNGRDSNKGLDEDLGRDIPDEVADAPNDTEPGQRDTEDNDQTDNSEDDAMIEDSVDSEDDEV